MQLYARLSTATTRHKCAQWLIGLRRLSSKRYTWRNVTAIFTSPVTETLSRQVFRQLHYILNFYANHGFQDISKTNNKYLFLAKQIFVFSKTNKTFTAIAFYYDQPLVLIWTKFDYKLFGYYVYAKKVSFSLFQIIITFSYKLKWASRKILT